MQQRIVLLERTGLDFCAVFGGVGPVDGERLGERVLDGGTFFDAGRDVAVHAKDVVCDQAVAFVIDVVGHDE